MAEVVVSRLAALDLEDIYIFSLRLFGTAQAERYVRELHSRFDMLAEFPGIGLSTTLGNIICMKFPSGRHVIYYRPTERGVLVGRILHGAQDPMRQGFW